MKIDNGKSSKESSKKPSPYTRKPKKHTKSKLTHSKQNLNYQLKLKFKKMSNTPNIKTKLLTSTCQASTATTPTPNTKLNPHENFHQPIK